QIVLCEILLEALPDRDNFRRVGYRAKHKCIWFVRHIGALLQNSGSPQTALPMKSYSTSVVGAITVAARASRKWRSTPTSLRKAAPPQTRIARSVTSV